MASSLKANTFTYPWLDPTPRWFHWLKLACIAIPTFVLGPGHSPTDLPLFASITLIELDFHLEIATIRSPWGFCRIWVTWVTKLLFSSPSFLMLLASQMQTVPSLLPAATDWALTAMLVKPRYFFSSIDTWNFLKSHSQIPSSVTALTKFQLLSLKVKSVIYSLASRLPANTLFLSKMLTLIPSNRATLLLCLLALMFWQDLCSFRKLLVMQVGAHFSQSSRTKFLRRVPITSSPSRQVQFERGRSPKQISFSFRNLSSGFPSLGWKDQTLTLWSSPQLNITLLCQSRPETTDSCFSWVRAWNRITFLVGLWVPQKTSSLRKSFTSFYSMVSPSCAQLFCFWNFLAYIFAILLQYSCIVDEAVSPWFANFLKWLDGLILIYYSASELSQQAGSLSSSIWIGR